MVRRRWMGPPALVWMIVVLVMASGCTSGRTAPEAGGGSTTSTSSPPTSEQPRPLVGWTGDPLVLPLQADNDALTVLDGAPPGDVSEDQAVALAHQVLGGATTQVTIQPVSGTVTVSLPPAQVGPGVPTIVNLPAWVIGYRNRVVPGCPMRTGPPSVPPDASNLDALIIMGPSMDHVVVYHGAGTGLCNPADRPSATVVTNLRPLR